MNIIVQVEISADRKKRKLLARKHLPCWALIDFLIDRTTDEVMPNKEVQKWCDMGLWEVVKFFDARKRE